MKSRYANNEIDYQEYQAWLSKHKDESMDSKLAVLNAIPIKLTYYIDVYTRYQKENDLYMRNLIFNFVNYPTFQIRFNYNSIPIEHNGNIILGETVSTDSPSIKLFADQICKQTLTISIEDAYLWDTRLHSTLGLSEEGACVEIYDQDRNEFIIEHI